MLKEINLKNWKSFENLNFKFENLNILVGENASGKSNFLEALELLKLKAMNASDTEINKIIRGGINYFKTIDENNKMICEGIVKSEDREKVYKLNLSKETITEEYEALFSGKYLESNFEKYKEMERYISELKGLEKQIKKAELKIKNTSYTPAIKVDISKELKQLKKILTQTSNYTNELINLNKKAIDLNNKLTLLKMDIEKSKQKEIEEEKCILKEDLSKIRVIDPIPKEIRSTNSTNEEYILDKNCKNLIPYILTHKDKKEIEEKLLKYLNLLIGKNITKIEFKEVGDNKESGQIYLEEIVYRNGKKSLQKLHSGIISDGTLRFIAIICALLTQEEESLLAIEEIDNGIAPSKIKMLLDTVDDLSLEKKYDLLVTTHNVNLMNYIGEKYFEFIFLVYKEEYGYSKICRLRDVENITKIMSYGQIGDLLESRKFYELAGLEDTKLDKVNVGETDV